MSVWSSSQALAGLLGCTDPSEGAENLPGCEASVQVLVVGHSREQVAGAACDSQDNLIFVASAQLLVRKDNRVENNNLSRNGDTAAWGENAKGLAGGGEAASVNGARVIPHSRDIPRIVMDGVRRPSRKRVSLSILA